MARFSRRPLCSLKPGAIVALAPTQVTQVSNECWLLIAAGEDGQQGRQVASTRTELNSVNSHVNTAR